MTFCSHFQPALRNELQQLYATLLVGDCPCHGFTHVHGYTGGFYHLVCWHGVRKYQQTSFVYGQSIIIQRLSDCFDYFTHELPAMIHVPSSACGISRFNVRRQLCQLTCMCSQTLKLYQNEHNNELIVISPFYCCPQVTMWLQNFSLSRNL